MRAAGCGAAHNVVRHVLLCGTCDEETYAVTNGIFRRGKAAGAIVCYSAIPQLFSAVFALPSQHVSSFRGTIGIVIADTPSATPARHSKESQHGISHDLQSDRV